uniref:Uncharacterized protein n=1 Tax=viral metagenome TaxID=1070528 RepID=A0A2V0RBX7_9ZZZZ
MCPAGLYAEPMSRGSAVPGENRPDLGVTVGDNNHLPERCLALEGIGHESIEGLFERLAAVEKIADREIHLNEKRRLSNLRAFRVIAHRPALLLGTMRLILERRLMRRRACALLIARSTFGNDVYGPAHRTWNRLLQGAWSPGDLAAEVEHSLVIAGSCRDFRFKYGPISEDKGTLNFVFITRNFGQIGLYSRFTPFGRGFEGRVPDRHEEMITDPNLLYGEGRVPESSGGHLATFVKNRNWHQWSWKSFKELHQD